MFNTLVGKFGGFAGGGAGTFYFKFLLLGGHGVAALPGGAPSPGEPKLYGGVSEYTIDMTTQITPVSLIYNHKTMLGGGHHLSGLDNTPTGLPASPAAGDGIFLSTASSVPSYPYPAPGFKPSIIAAVGGAGGVGGSSGANNNGYNGDGGGGTGPGSWSGSPGLTTPNTPSTSTHMGLGASVSAGGAGSPGAGGSAHSAGEFMVGGQGPVGPYPGPTGEFSPGGFTGGGGGGGYYGGGGGTTNPQSGGVGGGGSGYVNTSYPLYYSSGGGDGISNNSNYPGLSPQTPSPAGAGPAARSKIWLAVIPSNDIAIATPLSDFTQLEGVGTTTTKTITINPDGTYTIA
jgi:hypothetical protein